MKNIPQLQNFLADSVSLYPNKIVISTNESSYSFLDVENQSNSLAGYLQSIQIKRGDRVVVLLGNTIETVISFWAILKIGAIVIPAGTELKPSKIKYILDDSEASVLITNSEIALENKEIVETSNLKKALIPNKPESLQHNLFKNFETTLKQQGSELKPSGAISIDLAAIIYTSGSTGEPKGVMLSHANMIAATNSLNAYLGYKETDKVLCALPLSFDYGLYQMIMSVSTGATLLLEKEFTWPIFLLKKIVKEKVTVFPAVPTMVMLMYEQNKKKQLDLSSVRLVSNTGAALTRTNVEMVKNLFPKAQIFSMYGLTECKRCTYLPPADIDKKINSVGIAIPNTELWLIDAEGNKITKPNQIGQLVIRGATVMQSYWKKLEKTAEKLKEGIYSGEKVLHTGDFCSLDEDGYLYFKGRMDHMIKSRGIKVSPKEVEDTIGEISQIEAVVVTAVPHEDYGDALFAFVVCHNEETISEKEVIAFCQKNMEAYKVPEYVQIIDKIPKTPNGKFNVIELKETALQQVSKSVIA